MQPSDDVTFLRLRNDESDVILPLSKIGVYFRPLRPDQKSGKWHLSGSTTASPLIPARSDVSTRREEKPIRRRFSRALESFPLTERGWLCGESSRISATDPSECRRNCVKSPHPTTSSAEENPFLGSLSVWGGRGRGGGVYSIFGMGGFAATPSRTSGPVLHPHFIETIKTDEEKFYVRFYVRFFFLFFYRPCGRYRWGRSCQIVRIDLIYMGTAGNIISTALKNFFDPGNFRINSTFPEVSMIFLTSKRWLRCLG